MSETNMSIVATSWQGLGDNPEDNHVYKIPTHDSPTALKLTKLDETNWSSWRDQMKRALRHYQLQSYADGTLPCPNTLFDARNWEHNDNFAQMIIMTNIEQNQSIHISQCDTAHAMWMNLEAVHESKGNQTAMAIMRNIWGHCAGDNDNIPEHITTLKTHWDRLNLVDDDDFAISERQFKVLISTSLPSSWDAFTDQYIGGGKKEALVDPKKRQSVQQFIGLIREEYMRRVNRTQKLESTNQVTGGKRDLAARMGQPQANQRSVNPRTDGKPRCRHCNRRNHKTANCFYKNKCDTCGKKGHSTKDCWSKFKDQPSSSANNAGGSAKPEQAHHAEVIEPLERRVTFFVQPTDIVEQCDGNITQQTDTAMQQALGAEQLIDDVEQLMSVEGLDKEDRVSICSGDEELKKYVNCAYTSTANDERVHLYEWLADSATTSHVANQRETFTTYRPQSSASVAGVGGTMVVVEGRGTVELESECGGTKYILELHDVLHIPTNKNNLLSLGRWDAAGSEYKSKGGVMTLITKDGRTVATGHKVINNLYKMQVTVRTAKDNAPIGAQTFAATEPLESWETWHKRFGHVSYSGLKRLWEKNLVDGFTVDTRTPTPDCVACTEAKQTEEPHNKRAEQQTAPGELTHIDLWGKYDVASVNGHQYFILFVDDATRHITTNFLRKKDEATQAVKDYLTHLTAHRKPPRATCTDLGREFVNESLRTWCCERGIENQTTAPYSPASNGIVERANRMLVELARAMIVQQNMPEFLWEHAVAHAAYIRNRSYMRSLRGETTPYELWYKCKPSVAHLREFGAPVWILLQGQAEQRKLLPKSQRRAYVGYEDGPRAVKYYTADTKRVLTSRNYRFLSPPAQGPSAENIEVAPDEQREGESRGGTLSSGAATTGT
jgi:transposase InsO family protein